MLLCDLQLKTAPQIFLALKKPETYYNTIFTIKNDLIIEGYKALGLG